MPTGYTADIANDISFKDFVLKAAEAFGFGRSEEYFEESTYYTEMYNEAANRVIKLERMTREEKLAFATAEIEKETASVQSQFNQAILLKNKYEAMLEKVRSWNCGPEFVELKKFMVSQIEDSIVFDCVLDYYISDLTRLATVDKMAEYERILRSTQLDKEYYQEGYRRRDAKHKAHVDWEEKLRKNLK